MGNKECQTPTKSLAVELTNHSNDSRRSPVSPTNRPTERSKAPFLLLLLTVRMEIWSISCDRRGFGYNRQTRTPFNLTGFPSLEVGKKDKVKMQVTMRDRSKNRKPLQKGRNLSIEAIQTIQSLKRSYKSSADNQQQVIDSKFSRLLKFDMMAILRELLRQDHCVLALMVFVEIQKEHWYKPSVSLYGEIISALARSGLHDNINIIVHEMKAEKGRLEAKTEGFNLLLESLMSYNLIEAAMDCFELMKEVDCEPDRSTFKLLVAQLDSKGETGLSESIRKEAFRYYGDSIEFVNEQEEVTAC
ncbi:putative tetratricopeptide-like helical domain superfamily [Helianthus annuus]|uniref:Putative pentatricopeptide repeat protein n=1 Tax=Helianthus annuus TaxID=4232 RepID=A0A251VD63_HELAN|nr:protein THYLAKOID ASSEMBLY 8, chloroplastic [Helianthus annuus]KAF5816804.1 putative tetratricopeptide-like helical domain superfamily [Helianthus annuus]KAJ0610068.1 putative tetratricopeptide-like helical domain superfamily, protein THYLAKOID ASSEMBLY 8 [Helianthus annuus]KAJ0819049.1 putative tetratricopeptide-like helical domain superfamily, protein THYLAKOID ASSEMBLY 8 [Helianthus annuus]